LLTGFEVSYLPVTNTRFIRDTKFKVKLSRDSSKGYHKKILTAVYILEEDAKTLVTEFTKDVTGRN